MFLTFFILKKTLNSHCENNGILKHLCTKTEKNQSAAHKIIADFVLDLLTFSITPSSIMQHYNIASI